MAMCPACVKHLYSIEHWYCTVGRILYSIFYISGGGYSVITMAIYWGFWTSKKKDILRHHSNHMREGYNMTSQTYIAHTRLRTDNTWQSNYDLLCNKQKTAARRDRRSLCRLLNKAGHLTAFHAFYGSLHLPVTPAQLIVLAKTRPAQWVTLHNI